MELLATTTMCGACYMQCPGVSTVKYACNLRQEPLNDWRGCYTHPDPRHIHPQSMKHDQRCIDEDHHNDLAIHLPPG